MQNKKVELVQLRTIKYLTEIQKICPEYLGEFSSSEGAERLVDGYFGVLIVNGTRDVIPNKKKIRIAAQAVATLNKVYLKQDEMVRVCDGIAETVRREYLELVREWGSEYQVLMAGTVTIH